MKIMCEGRLLLEFVRRGGGRVGEQGKDEWRSLLKMLKVEA